MNNKLSWPISSIVYQIYPRSFMDSNNDGIGDLQGIIQKIPYLEGLGINAIWLSPIYPSPQKDFGYDVADYCNIDKVYGNLSDFDELLALCHKKGMKVMMDYIPNHTSSEHSWFKESRKSISNSKRDWYIWASPKEDGTPPNNWISVFGGSSWEYDEVTGQYYLHTFDSHQPDLNWRNPQVQKAMFDVLRFWMDRGVDGFRVDAPYHMFKDPLLRDEPQNPNYQFGLHSMYDSLLHVYTSWLHESFFMMKQLVEVLKEHKDKFMVAESWGTIDDLLLFYKTVGWKWYQPFNFSLITLPWTAEVHKEYIDRYDKILGEHYLPSWVLGNHDKHRVATRIGKKQARIAAMLQLTLRGLPFIYYGEELGMTNTRILRKKVKDPYEIKSPGLNLGRDPERTPMQWNESENAGFTKDEPWLPVNKFYKKNNAENEKTDPYSFYNLYKKLIILDKNNTAIREGEYTPVRLPAKNVYAFLRETKGEKVLVLLNFSRKTKELKMKLKGTVLLNSSLDEEGSHIDLDNFKLRGDEGYIIKI